MIDFVLNLLSSILQVDLRDHHSIPFALPLMLGCSVVGMVGFNIVRSLEIERKERQAELKSD